MTRLVRDWTEERVDATPVAPHRYTTALNDYSDVDDRDAFFAAVPYKAGDVIYVQKGLNDDTAALARVVYVFRERTRSGEWREKYRVQLATKAGTWSRCWVYVWPGHVQRGYNVIGFTE